MKKIGSIDKLFILHLYLLTKNIVQLISNYSKKYKYYFLSFTQLLKQKQFLRNNKSKRLMMKVILIDFVVSFIC